MSHAALAEPIAVSWHAVRLGEARLHLPLAASRVVVLGGGAIGLAAGLVARHFGARDIRIGEPNPLRRSAIGEGEGFGVYEPGTPDEPAAGSVDLVVDAVGAGATRAAACSLVRSGGVIVHLGLLRGQDGLDIRRITLHEVSLTGSYCYTPSEFRQVVEALAERRLGGLGWFEERGLGEGAAACADIDAGSTPFAKIVLRP